MITPTAVFFGLAVASPILWAALTGDTVPVDAAFQRLLVVLVCATLGCAAVQRLVGAFVAATQRSAVEQQLEMDAGSVPAGRRATDA